MDGSRHGDESPAGGIFRPAAVAHHRSAAARLGEVLRLSPAWLSWAYRLLVVFGVVALGVLCLCRVDEEITGPAEVQGEDGVTVIAAAAGTVTVVTTLPGRRVREGETLLLVAPAGGGGDRSRLSVVAPVAGLVADVLVRPGDIVAPGTPVAVLRPTAGASTVAGILPLHGGERPAVGGRGIFRPAGQPRRFVPVLLTAVGDAAVAGEAAARFAGTGGTVPPGSWLAVTATVTGGPEGGRLPEGTRGTLTVPVGRRRLITALVPALAGRTGRGDDRAAP